MAASTVNNKDLGEVSRTNWREMIREFAARRDLVLRKRTLVCVKPESSLVDT